MIGSFWIGLAAASAVMPALVAAQSPPSFPPKMPAAFPEWDERELIPDSFLSDPLITEAVAWVKSKVPAELLSIVPSTPSPTGRALVDGVKYNGDAAKNCYWTASQCTREQGTAYYQADVVKCNGQNQWGLSYDDGPSENTASVLSGLAANNFKATFFCLGTLVNTFPQYMNATMAAGHEISSHTWNHMPATTLTNEQFIAQIKYTEAAIYKVTGKVPAMWRPPYGDIDDRIRAIASALGYRTVVWTTTPPRDTQDTGATNETIGSIVSTIKSWFTPQDGFITLEHDRFPITSQIATQTLQAIKDMGSSFPLKPQPISSCANVPSYQTAAIVPGGAPANGINTTSGTVGSSTTTRSPNVASPSTKPRSNSTGESSNAFTYIETPIMSITSVLAMAILSLV